MTMRVAVLGAGHGGHAMAGDLTLSGHEVRFAAVPGHDVDLAVLNARGGIVMEGVTSSGREPGFASVAMITDDVAAAVRGAHVVMVVIPAFAQQTYMDLLVDLVEPGQIVVFNPGKFAAMHFGRMLSDAGRLDDVTVGETHTLIYAARMKPGGHTWIMGVKNAVNFAAFPADRTLEALDVLNRLYPQFRAAGNVMETSLDDNSMTLHAISTILNTSRIELMGPYRSGYYDVTPGVGRVIQAVDDERREVSARLGNPALDFAQIYALEYGSAPGTVCEIIRGVAAYDVMPSPDSMTHRYISEEIPFGLVPIASLAELTGVAAPGTVAMIHLAGLINDVDYWAQGRTADALGLAGLDTDGVVAYVMSGKR